MLLIFFGLTSVCRIDTPGVIERVSTLFRAHPRLIIGFNTFLPPGYSLEPTNNPADPVRVTTPANVQYRPASAAPATVATQPPRKQAAYEAAPAHELAASVPTSSSSRPQRQAAQQAAAATSAAAAASIDPPPPSRRPANEPAGGRGPVEFNHAINYVNKIKTRFANQPDTYRYFLEILQAYQRDDKPIREVFRDRWKFTSFCLSHFNYLPHFFYYRCIVKCNTCLQEPLICWKNSSSSCQIRLVVRRPFLYVLICQWICLF